MAPGTSTPSGANTSPGGVGRNIAENLCHLGRDVQMIGAVGIDEQSEWLVANLRNTGVGVAGIDRVAGVSPGVYAALVNADGTLAMAASAMQATDGYTVELLARHEKTIRAASALVIDANMPSAVIERALAVAAEGDAPCFVEPVSQAKAARLAEVRGSVFLATPSANEDAVLTDGPLNIEWRVVTLGADGCQVFHRGERVASLEAIEVAAVDETGAGDALMSGIVAGVDAHGSAIDSVLQSVRDGMALAASVVQRHGSTIEGRP